MPHSYGLLHHLTIASMGRLKSKRLRGRMFSCGAMAISSSWLCADKSVPSGTYWREFFRCYRAAKGCGDRKRKSPSRFSFPSFLGGATRRREGARGSDPGGLRPGRLDPRGRRSGQGHGQHLQEPDVAPSGRDRRAPPRLPRPECVVR